jgi:citronellyl-CoA dehydrogenase
MPLTSEHDALRATVKRRIDAEGNPFVDQWEEAERFPGASAFPPARRTGIARHPQARGIRRPRIFLFRYVCGSLGGNNCGSVPMAIGAQTDVCTPALVRRGGVDRA